MADDSAEIVKEAAEAVAFENVKVGGGGPSFWTNLAMKQAVEASAGWTTINQSVVGALAQQIVNTSPTESGGDIAALGQLLKGLQMTPPPTNIPTQGT